MGATISEMRGFIMAQYPDNFNWHRKVHNMRTNQVIAIYYSMKERIAKKKKKEAEEAKRKLEEAKQPTYHQIDMWEYLASINNNHTEIEWKGRL